MVVEELDVISAMWILACNDENPILTYEGIRHRLALPATYDVRALVRKRGELFRLGANPEAFEKWKAKMLAGRDLPSWVRVLRDEEAQRNVIQSLTTHDVFRSQFRAARDAEKSPVEVMKWGLEHIDRLRKARLEARDASVKSWQLWLVFAVGVLNIIVTLYKPK